MVRWKRWGPGWVVNDEHRGPAHGAKGTSHVKSLGTRRRRHGGHLEYQYQDIEVFGCTSLLTMPPKLNVHNFPRPPLLEKTPRHLQIKWNNQLIADTKDAYWALETTHPPSNIITPQHVLHTMSLSYLSSKFT